MRSRSPRPQERSRSFSVSDRGGAQHAAGGDFGTIVGQIVGGGAGDTILAVITGPMKSRCGSANERDELPTIAHSITSSASASTVAGMSRPSDPSQAFRIVRGGAHEHSDASHRLDLLRARRARPRRADSNDAGNLPTRNRVNLQIGGKSMPDLTSPGPQDRSRISLLEPHEVQYWADKFNVSKERLSEAVKNVGHSAAAVEKELKRLA
jgi:hypothetical protein